MKILRLHLHLWMAVSLAGQSAVAALHFDVPLASLTHHNTSAYDAYNQASFPANFGTATWINPDGETMRVDPGKMDESLNPVTPGHVSQMDVHTLIPSRPDLRWFAHATPWFGSSHINIGLNNNSSRYVAAMITDMKNRGFNGVIIDWYGRGSWEDDVTLKVQSYLAGLANNVFTYIIMLDHGVHGGRSLANLQAQIEYCQRQYFNDPNYEREPLTNGLPILMFFGMRNSIGASAMSSLKARTGGRMIWVEQGARYLSESWEDECFAWAGNFTRGVNSNDPFNLAAVTNIFPALRESGKKAFGAMCAHFNGTLTRSVRWSKGKYLPSGNGLCEVERAAAINCTIPPNMTRMQWVTWNDWEEGSEVEAGIENGFSLRGKIEPPNRVSWTPISGDERTIDHYEIYASSNGVTAAFLGSAPASEHQMDLSGFHFAPGKYLLYVDAVGKPCIRDHLGPPIPYGAWSR